MRGGGGGGPDDPLVLLNYSEKIMKKCIILGPASTRDLTPKEVMSGQHR